MLSRERSLLAVMLKALMHERRCEALDDTRRDAALLELLKLKANRPFWRSRGIHGGEQISVHIRNGNVRVFDVGRQPVADSSRGANNPSREDASVGSPVFGIENAIHEEMRMASQDIDFFVIFILQLKQVLINLTAALLPASPLAHAVVRRKAVGRRFVHSDYDRENRWVLTIARQDCLDPLQLCVIELILGGIVHINEINAVVNPVVVGSNLAIGRVVFQSLLPNGWRVQQAGKTGQKIASRF